MAEKVAPIVVDFTNVKDRGPYNPKRKPAGDYKAKITAVEQTKSSKDNPMLIFAVQLVSDASAVYPERCVLTDASLWRLRNLLLAAGLSVPKKKVKVDPNKALGRVIGVTLEDDEYEGKMKSVISAVFKESELTDDEPEGDEDSDEEQIDEDEVDELEVDEL